MQNPPRGRCLRKSLETVAVIALAALWVMTAYSLSGPDRLPGRIPTHFDLAGNPNGWGAPQILWLLPGFATLIYATMSMVARFPAAFNYPVRVTPANRAILEGWALRLISWLKAETICLFTWIQYHTIEAAKSGRGGLSPISILAAVVVVFVTVGWHLIAMRRAA